MAETSRSKTRREGGDSIIAVPIFRKVQVGEVTLSDRGDVPFEVAALNNITEIVHNGVLTDSYSKAPPMKDAFEVEHENRRVRVELG